MKNKIIILLFVTIVPFFIGINSVSADSCSKVNETIDSYNKIQKNMDSIKCGTSDGSVSSGECISLAREQALYLQKLFNYNDKNTCKSDELEKIIEENKDTCSDELNSSIKKITKTMMNIFYLLAPFLFLIFGGIDLAKIVVLSDQKLAKKAKSDFAKRLTAFILVFFIPAFVNIILSFTGATKLNNMNSNNYICTVDFDKYQTTTSTVTDNNSDYITQTTKAIDAMSGSNDNALTGTILSGYTSGNSSSTTNKTAPRRKYTFKTYTVLGAAGLRGVSSRKVGTTGNVKLLQAADRIHQVYEKEQWRYYTDSSYNLFYSDIKSSTYNTKATCCATFISSALYEGGFLTEEFINRYGYNCVSGVSAMLRDSGWIMITNVNDLIPGDVVITDNQARDNVDGHVELFAGWDIPNGLWSGAGSTNSIQNVAPSDKGDYMISRFRYAWRQP